MLHKISTQVKQKYFNSSLVIVLIKLRILWILRFKRLNFKRFTFHTAINCKYQIKTKNDYVNRDALLYNDTHISCVNAQSDMKFHQKIQNQSAPKASPFFSSSSSSFLKRESILKRSSVPKRDCSSISWTTNKLHQRAFNIQHTFNRSAELLQQHTEHNGQSHLIFNPLSRYLADCNMLEYCCNS